MHSTQVRIVFCITLATLSGVCYGGKSTQKVCPSSASAPADEKSYNPYTEVCCNGEVRSQRDGFARVSGYIGCCGGEFFFQNEKTCCGDRFLPAGMECCNDIQPFNQTSQLCCGTHVANKGEKVCCPGGDNYQLQPYDSLGEPQQCCGNAGTFRPDQQLCCQTSGQARIHDVRRSSGSGLMGCCGLDQMDETTHMCCNGVSTRKTDAFHECCGQGTYDVRTHVCCSGQSFPIGRDGQTECCGQRTYNPDNEQCCNNNVFPGKGKCCGLRKVYSPIQQSCCMKGSEDAVVTAGVPHIPQLTQCCGTDAYLDSSKMCCSGNLFDRDNDRDCCGHGTYDTANQLCCNGVTITKTSVTDQCCGSALYDPATQTCCRDQMVGGVGECCYISRTRSQSYDPETQTCCQSRSFNAATGALIVEGAVHDQGRADNLCCGTSLTTTGQLCREGVLHDKERESHNAVCCHRNGTNCQTYSVQDQYCLSDGKITSLATFCGDEPYDPQSELCCANAFKYQKRRFGDEHAACCSFQAYDREEQSCHLNNVFDVPEAYAEPCRNLVFNNQTEACDLDYNIRPKQEVQEYPYMCGTEKYRQDEHRCCGVQLIGQDFTCCDETAYNTPGTALGETACCRTSDGSRSVGYNAHTQICCNGKVNDTNGKNLQCCGRDAYDPQDPSHICCLDNLQLRSEGSTTCTGNIAHGTQQLVCDGVIHDATQDGVCCGRNMIDSNAEICCNGISYTREGSDTTCCGKVAYTGATQLCCGDSLYNKTSPQDSDTCCGSVKYDPASGRCLEVDGSRYVFAIDAGREDALCGDGYDSSRHTCCGGILHRNVANGECCGSSMVRNPTTQLCCANKVQEKWNPTTSCCGGRLYNPDSHICCGERLLWIYSHRRRCHNGAIVPRG